MITEKGKEQWKKRKSWKKENAASCWTADRRATTLDDSNRSKSLPVHHFPTMDAGNKYEDPPASSSSSDQDGKKPSLEEGTSKQETRTKQTSVGERGASMESIEYDGDEYDDYDDFDLITSGGFGGGGGSTKREHKRKEKGSAATNIYSSKHTRMREARKGKGK